ncbi:recombinase family protein [Antribacter gilvus]|uniref:recombinase family protein n=1 Tax=Antribacter gilvus TaxID=2304675 RepID=UPI000F7B2A08|nr:recombinase family protein [Antribacter gilvus]
MARVLGVLRQSKFKPGSLSMEDQRTRIAHWASSNGHEVVAWTEDDEGVKGDQAPWKRPGLGPWLPGTIGREDPSEVEVRRTLESSRADEWDMLCAWRLDRLSRSIIHTHQLGRWALAQGKSIVTLENGFNLATREGRMLYGMLSMFAENEHDAIKERMKASHDRLMQAGRWRGGQVPYGYRQMKSPDGNGWVLVVDDDGENTASIAREIVRRVVNGESINGTCRWLNEAGIPTSMDVQRIRRNKEPKGYQWRPGNLHHILRSHSLLGQASHWVTVERDDGQEVQRTRVITNEDGSPVQRADPLISLAEWQELQAAINERGDHRGRGAVRVDRRMLHRILFCICGDPLYTRLNGHGTLYYVCSKRNNTGAACKVGKSIRGETAEKELARMFLGLVGDVEVVRREFVAGSNHDAQISEIDRGLDELEDDRRAGLYGTPTSLDRFRRQYLALTERREALAAIPVEPDQWRDVPTGETYREVWGRLTTDQERNTALRAAGVYGILHPTDGGRPYHPKLYSIGHDVDFEWPEDEADYTGPSFVYQRSGRIEMRVPATWEERIRAAVSN